MQLKYRGISYDYIPPQQEMTSSDEVGRYRGLEWRFRKPKQVAVLQSTLDLVYRGVAYQAGPATAPSVAPVAAAPAQQATDRPSVPALARTLMMSHHRWIKSRQQSLLGRAATEIGLSPESGDYWSHIQGKVHPSFRNSYDRSHVAFS